VEEKYKDYLISFNNLDVYDKRKEIIDELFDLIRTFYKINKDFNIDSQILPVVKDYGTEEEYLTRLCSCILSLKEVSAGTMQIILDNLYEK